MWIVRLALRRPYTFVVMAILIAIFGAISIVTMPTDIFPYINIPVVGVIWSYQGMSPDDMAKRVLTVSERAMTTTVNDIEHIESTAYNGVGLIRVYMQPGTNVDLAVAQVTAVSQTLLRALPPGIFPPLVVQYDASSVPILQLGLNSNTLTEQQLYDYGQNFIRTRLSTVPGISVPLALRREGSDGHGRSRSRCAVWKASVRHRRIECAQSAKPDSADGHGENRHVGISDSTQQQSRTGDRHQRHADQDGERRAGLYAGCRAGARRIPGADQHRPHQRQPLRAADDLETRRRVHAGRGQRREGTAAEDCTPRCRRASRSRSLFDQSLFVRASVSGVVREAMIAAFLTALMILLFLGSWRSTVIVCLSIPLSILTSLIVLGLLGQTINVMTLGGLALAVGILVDDATVEIENVHRNMGIRGKTLVRAILDGAQQIALPAFVSTLCICIVFVPVLMLSGAAKYLFTPLAMAVVFAMLTSYLLTRTIVPTLVHYLLPAEMALYQEGEEGGPRRDRRASIWRIHQAFERRFEKIARTRTMACWTGCWRTAP